MAAFLLKIDEIIGMVLNAPTWEVISLILFIVWFFGAAFLICIVMHLNIDALIDMIRERLINRKQNREEPDGQS